MSREETVDVECPGCTKPAKQVVHLSANVTLEPALKQRLFSGELFVFTCPSCALKVPMKYACLYHDVEKQLMVQLAPDGAEATMSALQAFADSDPKYAEYRLRVVTTVTDLLEKVLAFEAKLNDGVLEFLKLAALASTPHLRGAELHFDGVGEKKDLEFIVLRDNQPPTFTTLSRKAYDQLCKGPCAELARFARRKGKWRVVDTETVRKFLPKK